MGSNYTERFEGGAIQSLAEKTGWHWKFKGAFPISQLLLVVSYLLAVTFHLCIELFANRKFIFCYGSVVIKQRLGYKNPGAAFWSFMQTQSHENCSKYSLVCTNIWCPRYLKPLSPTECFSERTWSLSITMRPLGSFRHVIIKSFSIRYLLGCKMSREHVSWKCACLGFFFQVFLSPHVPLKKKNTYIHIK